jgi:hypothetical protein
VVPAAGAGSPHPELHPNNRNAYSNAKSDFVEQALRDRGVEVARRDPLPE